VRLHRNGVAPVSIPRVLVAGLSGGGGKTLVSLGLLAAWRRLGRTVAPFKKGPDYIDAAWLARAAGVPCRNLDLFLMNGDVAARSFSEAAAGADLAVIEGNRGLFDGVDAQGSYSTAALSILLEAPVLLVVDATKATRTVAAMVLGCQRLEPQVPLRGVILNRVAGQRHEAVLREAVTQACGLPVVGAVPRLPGILLADRHLGLVPPAEHDRCSDAITQAADVASRHLDLPAIEALARQAPALSSPRPAPRPPAARRETVRIGVLRDEAFQFYYPENLEALARLGARLVDIAPLRDAALPELDALYVGGGFPETLAAGLTANAPFRASVRRAAEAGLPIYAECGGAIYLGQSLRFEGREYDMTGVLPVAFAFEPRPQGHGYAVLQTVLENPFFPVGDTLRGHEFHYTHLAAPPPPELRFAFRVDRGHGFDGRGDGLTRGNVLACYTHLHALGAERWAPGVVGAAERFRARDPHRGVAAD
jgi:cobyrinic acid a,c-diamide synthase